MTNENMNDVDGIEVVEKAATFDANKYDGYKSKIDGVKKIEVPDYFPNGVLDRTSTAKRMVLELSTEPLKEIDDKGNLTNKEIEYLDEDGEPKKFVIRQQVALQKRVDKATGAITWVISKHPKSKAYQLLRKKGCEKPSELVGKNVILVAEPSKTEGDDRVFLRISI